MRTDWIYIPGKLSIPLQEDVMKAIAGLPTVGYREQSGFYYPRRGCIYTQWLLAYRKAESMGVVFLKEEVVEVRRVGGRFLINGRLEADRVISTLPLREMPRIFSLGEEAFRAASHLDCNSMVVVGVGIRRRAPQRHWVYVPNMRYVFHCYAWISNYGEDTPEGKSVLIVEITALPGRAVDLENFKTEVIKGMAVIGEFREEDVEVAAAWLHKYGYPIYTLTHSEDTSVVQRALTEVGVTTFG